MRLSPRPTERFKHGRHFMGCDHRHTCAEKCRLLKPLPDLQDQEQFDRCAMPQVGSQFRGWSPNRRLDMVGDKSP